MTKDEIITRAREAGLGEHLLNINHRQLIPMIQEALDQEPCYLSDSRYDCNNRCEWSSNCEKTDRNLAALVLAITPSAISHQRLLHHP